MRITWRLFGFFCLVFLLCKGDGCGGSDSGAGLPGAQKTDQAETKTPAGGGNATPPNENIPPRGNPEEKTMTGLEKVVKIAAGGGSTCAIIGDGSVKCWGENFGGPDSEYEKVKNEAGPWYYLTPHTVANLSKVTNVAVDGSTKCAYQSNGETKCWGNNWKGAAGVGGDNVYYVSTPTTVAALSSFGVKSLAHYHGTGVAVTLDEKAYCWGANTVSHICYGLDTMYSAVTLNNDLNGVLKVSLHGAASCGIFRGGVVKCWGAGPYGQFGDGMTHHAGYPVIPYSVDPAAKVPGVGLASDIAVGLGHACAIVGKNVVCWGSLDSTDLTKFSLSKPVTIGGLSDLPVALVSGDAHVCALLVSGAVQCWGYNADGQLGTGNVDSQWTFATVPDLSGVTQLAAGSHHTCALLNTGAVKCWGNNAAGQLGDGTQVGKNVPVTVLAGNE